MLALGRAVRRSSGVSGLLQLTDVAKSFRLRSGQRFQAVKGVSLEIEAGSTLGLVGESGCGKSTLARCVVGLHKPDSGSIAFAGQDLGALDRRSLQRVRRELTMVFQDPYASLNPRRRVGDIVAMPLDIHDICRGAERGRRVAELLERVGLSAEHAKRYPHEFSGGQRQRIGLARALVTGPRLVVLDEPVSALDVSVQAQILNLLMDLQADCELTLVCIAHDLGVVRHIARDVAVMYLGRIVEQASADELFARPLHHYSAGLLAAVPVPDPRVRRSEEALIRGDVTAATSTHTGCDFNPRCAFAQDKCRVVVPDLVESAAGHQVACHYPVTPP
ncbi:MAG: ATP-binding cassette domain-containing protein [Acidobacteriota bacterium]|nr:ATP-binding cassette domain-containing protein [Acidobacteriota bacterium]